MNVDQVTLSRQSHLSSIAANHVLEMLVEVAERPESQVRWQWAAGDAALWDNRCTMHYAVHDAPCR